MKSDTIDIGAYCTVGDMAVVLYGTRMNEGATLGPLSVLMKGEALPRWSRWHGVPSQPSENRATAPHRQRRNTVDATARPRRNPPRAHSLRQWLLSTSASNLRVAHRGRERTGSDDSRNTQDTAA